MSTPTSPTVRPRRRRRWKLAIALLAVGVVVALAVAPLVARFRRDVPVDFPDDDVLHFRYGSTGGERMTGIPYWLFIALPEIFPDKLPDGKPGRGYSAFGMIYEKGKDPRYDLPVGMQRRNYRGIDVVYLNCAVCHAGVYRKTPNDQPQIVDGMPANTFDLGAWGNFLIEAAKDERFTPRRFDDQIRVMQDDPHRLVDPPDLLNRLLFRFAAVYLMREQLIRFGDRLSFIDTKTWGPGRVDTFNAPKALLNFPMKHGAADARELVGNCDFPSIWNQGPRKRMQLHWDGNNTSVDERNLSAAFGTGAYPPTIDAKRVLRVSRWLKKNAQPIAYPYPIDAGLAERGKPIYREYCVGCHGTRERPYRVGRPRPGACVGTVVPIDAADGDGSCVGKVGIGTDRHRLDSYTWLLAVNQNTLYAGFEKDWGFDEPYPQRFSHFRKTNGYANSPLDGIWLRAPYLHNGSVPTLRDLLEPKAERPPTFYRGDDVYDPVNVGFVSNVAERNGRTFFEIDTAAEGNGNQGHEGRVYGTELPPDEKRALLEYLKTF